VGCVTDTDSPDGVAEDRPELTGVEAPTTAALAWGVKSGDQVPSGRSNTKGPGSATPSPP